MRVWKADFGNDFGPTHVAVQNMRGGVNCGMWKVKVGGIFLCHQFFCFKVIQTSVPYKGYFGEELRDVANDF
jgi:hypothetical protein